MAFYFSLERLVLRLPKSLSLLADTVGVKQYLLQREKGERSLNQLGHKQIHQTRQEASKSAKGARQGPCETALYHLRSGELGSLQKRRLRGDLSAFFTAIQSKDTEEMELDSSQKCTFIGQEATDKQKHEKFWHSGGNYQEKFQYFEKNFHHETG